MSSSSTLKSSTSHPHSYHYDVFLSFKGAYTRKTFTDHLYENLVAHGIHTFRDDKELENGGDIAADLDRAMRESRFFIIVFSKNYATSKWCLNELLKITKCMAEKGSEVIAIFYHVEPRDVGNREGSFKDAFSEHRKNADQEKEKLIGDWEIALKKVSKLKGVPVDDQ